MTKPKSDQGMRTPPWLFHLLQTYVYRHTKSRFRLDAATSKDNTMCRLFCNKEVNGLLSNWVDPTFCNPPFKYFGDWIKKAFYESLENSTHSCLLGPTGCSQSWFHQYAQYSTILVPNRRISFCDSVTGKPTSGADRDTMIYLFGPKLQNFNRGDSQFYIKALDVVNSKYIP